MFFFVPHVHATPNLEYILLIRLGKTFRGVSKKCILGSTFFFNHMAPPNMAYQYFHKNILRIIIFYINDQK